LKPFALVMVWWWWRRLGLFPSGIKSARFDRLQSYWATTPWRVWLRHEILRADY
jgi:hypothetical protein